MRAFVSVPSIVAYVTTCGSSDKERPLPTLAEMREMVEDAPGSPGHFCTLPAPNPESLCEFAKRLRSLAKDISRGGLDNHFVKAEAVALQNPVIRDWYFRACCFRDTEQQRFFLPAWLLIGEIASATADSPCERLKSLATDVDELVAMIAPQSASVDAVDDPKPVVVLGEHPQITIEGTPIALEHEHAVYINSLIEKSDWLSDAEFKKSHQEFGEHARPDRWRHRLPTTIKAHVETTNRGSRWVGKPLP